VSSARFSARQVEGSIEIQKEKRYETARPRARIWPYRGRQRSIVCWTDALILCGLPSRCTRKLRSERYRFWWRRQRGGCQLTRAGKRVATDAKHAYRVDGLPVGTYSVKIEHSGFKKYLRSGIPVSPGQLSYVDVSWTWNRGANRGREG